MSQRKVKRKKQFVTYQTRKTTQGTRNEPVDEWNDLLSNIPCTIEVLTGREIEQSRQMYPQAEYRVEMFNPKPEVTITAKGRLKYGTRTLQIGFVPDDFEANRDLVLLCSEMK